MEEKENQEVWLPFAKHVICFGASETLSLIFPAALKVGVTITTLQMRKLSAGK